ncbi:hypothetical protein RHECNPAF_13300119 [Rhizobium etli CNPAF512]|nr:hypothetical protein RHECNPAF_13300119 [Rhizobium etli CNPAF512]
MRTAESEAICNIGLVNQIHPPL